MNKIILLLVILITVACSNIEKSKEQHSILIKKSDFEVLRDSIASVYSYKSYVSDYKKPAGTSTLRYERGGKPRCSPDSAIFLYIDFMDIYNAKPSTIEKMKEMINVRVLVVDADYVNRKFLVFNKQREGIIDSINFNEYLPNLREVVFEHHAPTRFIKDVLKIKKLKRIKFMEDPHYQEKTLGGHVLIDWRLPDSFYTHPSLEEAFFKIVNGLNFDLLSKSKLKKLTIHGTGHFFEEFTDMPELRELDIDCYYKNDTLGDCIAKLNKLEKLRCGSFKGISPKISELKNLKNLEIHSDSLLRFPSSFGELKNLEFVKIYSTYLKEIPNMESAHNLQELDIRGRYIESSPYSFENFRELKKLQLKGLKTGSLPDGICNCSDLRYIRLTYSKINTIPLCVGRFEKLYGIYMEYVGPLEDLEFLFENKQPVWNGNLDKVTLTDGYKENFRKRYAKLKTEWLELSDEEQESYRKRGFKK